MGPCPFRHGYQAENERIRKLQKASMGPCPFRHGYQHTVRRSRRSDGASMGPCPFRHGYAAVAAYGRLAVTTLQWGHALSGMDTGGVTGFRLARINPLQWGHALSGMDTGIERKLPIKLDPASMGPCPFRHGYRNFGNRVYDSVPASMGPCPFRHGYQAVAGWRCGQ